MLGLIAVEHLHVILPGEDQGREVSASWGLALSQVGSDLVLESVDGQGRDWTLVVGWAQECQFRYKMTRKLQ